LHNDYEFALEPHQKLVIFSGAAVVIGQCLIFFFQIFFEFVFL